MNAPMIADKKPAVLDLEAGDYWWCTCGRSQNQPFCDGAHQGTGLTPAKFTLETSQKVALCQCKYSQNPPFCDGAHVKL
ncbi:CDGSH iron-sulfur domain-containing protein [Oxynema sp. CENA135]|uniref:CDGSH iron-sulfur domain-containing protein n=1 Tax=Oxynema sp. CENA135 TaxID=984206 RepID=UPI001909DF4C|nr:CDGSH iron-sulfur domain-containing protein [Oxynema sp. CENA135]